MPYVENGTVILVGATTENPSFELNSALLSRCQVFVLNRLSADDFEEILSRAEQHEGKKLPIDDEARDFIKEIADGDGRYILNIAENIWSYAQEGEIFNKEDRAEEIMAYGNETLKQLKAYQKSRKLKVDGYAGLGTHKAIISD